MSPQKEARTINKRLSILEDTGGEFAKAQARYTSSGNFARIGQATDC
jgi:hypothetical protein